MVRKAKSQTATKARGRARNGTAKAAADEIELDEEDAAALEEAAETDEDAEDAEDEEEADEDAVEDEDDDFLTTAEGEKFRRIRSLIDEAGAADVRLTVTREQPGRGPAVLPSLLLGSSDIASFRDLIVERFGGSGEGQYGVVFRVNGKYAGRVTFRAEGNPLPIVHRAQGEASPGIQAPAGGVASLGAGASLAGAGGPLTAEAVAKLLEDRLAADRREREMEELRRENARLLAETANPTKKNGGGEEFTRELTTAWKAVAAEAKERGEREDPAVKELKTRLEKQAEELERMKDKAHERELAENRARHDRLERLIRRRSKKPKASPMSGLLRTMTEMAAVDAALARMTSRKEEGDTGGLLDGFLAMVKPEAEKIGREVLRGMRRKVEEEARRQTAAAGASESSAQAWHEWVLGIFNNRALVADKAYVRKGLETCRPYVKRLIMLKDKADIVAFLRETMGDELAQNLDKAPDAQVVEVIETIELLRTTVVDLATADPEPEAETETAEDGEDDEDDEEADVVVDGKRVS